ncbi:TPA: DUF3265 domain-containing protein, partial [Vibrio vulnificus]|nr:DUF3265 domain-containing protein [Vibrio vulnificus]
ALVFVVTVLYGSFVVALSAP